MRYTLEEVLFGSDVAYILPGKPIADDDCLVVVYKDGHRETMRQYDGKKWISIEEGKNRRD